MVRAADIGIEFRADETGCFQITDLLPGPARVSGQIDVGDILYEIDGVKVLYGIGPNGRPLPEVEVKEMLRGLEGSVINLRIQKGRLGRIAYVSLVRSCGDISVRPASSISPQPRKEISGRERERAAPPPPPETPPRDEPADHIRMPVPVSARRNSATAIKQPMQYSSQRLPQGVKVVNMPLNVTGQLPMHVTGQMPMPLMMVPVQRPQTIIIPKPQERPLQEDKTPDKYYWQKYQPREPDRFGLGIVFKLLSSGRLEVQSIVKGGPAELSKQDLREHDLLFEIDRQIVASHSMDVVRTMLENKRIGQPVYLGFHRVGHEGLVEVKILKGENGLRCGVGIVFKSDPEPSKWVRVAQVVPGSAAEKAVAPSKVSDVIHVNDRVLAIDGQDISCQPFEIWKARLRGEVGSHIAITFADSKAKKYKINIYRDYIDQSLVNPDCCLIPPPKPAEEKPVQPSIYYPQLLRKPDQMGGMLGPVPDPLLWKSFIDEGKPDPADPQTFFIWKGQRLRQPEYLPDRSCRVFRIVDGHEEMIYWGPGCKELIETQQPYIKPETQSTTEPKLIQPNNKKEDDVKSTVPTTVTTANNPPSPQDNKSSSKPVTTDNKPPPPPPEDKKSSNNASSPQVKAPTVKPERERSSAPASPPAKEPEKKATTSPSPSTIRSEANPDNDDESTLILSDGRQIEAKKIEKILQKHLDAVAYVMVVGSRRKFLSCLLTIKTLGSDAVARGKDPDSVPNGTDLSGPALELAKSVGLSITNVMQARSSIEFRTKGLLPCFAKANHEIASQHQCQVKRFTILTTSFSQKTGELLPNGELNRMSIKNKYRGNVIEGMYKEKE